MISRSRPQKLYKYKTFNARLLRLLVYGESYYSRPTSFNDPLDCRPTLRRDVDDEELLAMFREIWAKTHGVAAAQEAVKSHRYSATEADDEHDRVLNLRWALMNDLEILLHRKMEKRGVLALSELWDHPLMWSHYGDEHRGVCIEYDLLRARSHRFRYVDYGGQRSISVTSLAAWIVRETPAARQEIEDIYFYSKAPQWEYEREWRDVTERDGLDDPGITISAIYFGFRCDPAVKQSIVKMINPKDGVDLYEVYPSTTDFTLNRREVEVDEIRARGIGLPASWYFDDLDSEDQGRP